MTDLKTSERETDEDAALQSFGRLADSLSSCTEEEWEQAPDRYLGDCRKQCYGPRVMEKGLVAEFGARGVYVCTGCEYAYPPGHPPEAVSLDGEHPEPSVAAGSVSDSLVFLPLKAIRVGERRRQLNPEKVKALRESIRQVGLLNPLTVRPNRALVAGWHRLEACRGVLEVVPATVVPFDDLDAELAEIDENLIRCDLTELEQLQHLKWREEILLAKGERARPGGQPGNQNARRDENEGDRLAPSFLTTAELAEELGVSKRTLQRQQQTARNLSPEACELLKDTPAANSQAELQVLSRQPEETQREIAAQIKGGETGGVREELEKRAKKDPGLAHGLQMLDKAPELWELGDDNISPERTTELQARAAELVRTGEVSPPPPPRAKVAPYFSAASVPDGANDPDISKAQATFDGLRAAAEVPLSGCEFKAIATQYFPHLLRQARGFVAGIRRLLDELEAA